MKPSYDSNFHLSVRRQSWEEDERIADLFDGVYRVELNHALGICFVPEVQWGASPWPPRFPDDPQDLTAVRDARLSTIALSGYAVTPDALRAGEDCGFLCDWLGEAERQVVFFVSSRDFESYARELAELAEARPAVHSGWTVEELKDRQVADLVLSRIIVSPHFQPRHRAMVGRGA